MDSEIRSFIKIWITAIASLFYCYYIGSKIPKGILRLVSLTPVIYLFTTLPLILHSFHLSGPTFLLFVWLGNFKLILFAFDKPPLSPLPNNPLHFISVASLPIKIIQKQAKPSTQNPNTANSNTNTSQSTKNQRDPTSHLEPKVSWPIPMPVKILLIGLIIKAYQYRPCLNSYVVSILYVWHMYLGIELILAICALPAKKIFGFELEPQFNEPYLTTSLQDFWGRRWNLMVPAILKPMCYEPVARLTLPILGRSGAQVAGFVWAFTVSGLAHEAIYYYLSRAWPTWEVTWFFVLHGVCTAAEMAVKKRARGSKWRPSKVVSAGFSMTFLMVSANWLFFPQLVRNGVIEKAIHEYVIMVDFVKKCFG